jgi:hypothetical protein
MDWIHPAHDGPSGGHPKFLEGGEILDYMSDIYLLNKNCVDCVS